MQIQKTGSSVVSKYHTKHSLTNFTLELAAGSVKVLTRSGTCPLSHGTDKENRAGPLSLNWKEVKPSGTSQLDTCRPLDQG